MSDKWSLKYVFNGSRLYYLWILLLCNNYILSNMNTSQLCIVYVLCLFPNVACAIWIVDSFMSMSVIHTQICHSFEMHSSIIIMLMIIIINNIVK